MSHSIYGLSSWRPESPKSSVSCSKHSSKSASQMMERAVSTAYSLSFTNKGRGKVVTGPWEVIRPFSTPWGGVLATTLRVFGRVEELLAPLPGDWRSKEYFLFLDVWGGRADNSPPWALNTAAFLISSYLFFTACFFFKESISETDE